MTTSYVHARGCPDHMTGRTHEGPCSQREGYDPQVTRSDVDSWSTASLLPALRPCCETPLEAVHRDSCPEERARREQAEEDARMGPVEGGRPIPVWEWEKRSQDGEDALDPPSPPEPAELVSHVGEDVLFHAVAEASNVGGMIDYVQIQSEPTDTPDAADLPPRYVPPTRAEPDLVNHPPHYKRGGIEVIDVIEAYELGFRLGNVVKYILRSDAKGATLQDLKKARWYLDREISAQEKETP